MRKAVGARARDILRQFLAEAVVLAMLGGVMGVLGGWAFAALVRAVSPLPARVTPWSVLLAVLARRGRRRGVRRVSGVARGAARPDRRAAGGMSALHLPSISSARTSRIAFDALRVEQDALGPHDPRRRDRRGDGDGDGDDRAGHSRPDRHTIEIAGPTTFYVMKVVRRRR